MEFSGSVITPAEAEARIRQLKPIPIEEVGTEGWKAQRESVELLNMCTHSNAVLKVDDYVKSFLVDHEQLPTLLHELLVMEVWRQRVLPSVKSAVAEGPTAAYLYCNYESILVNFFECICFYEEVVVAFGDDVLELIDYCWRQVSRLFSLPGLSEVEAPLSAEEMQRETAEARLEKQLRQGLITRAMGCISILWFTIDRLDALPLSASNAILQKNDLPVGLSEVLLLQPWLRRSSSSSSVTQKYRNGDFLPAPGDEALRVCAPEAHTWFCLHKLLCDPECRKRYPYTQHKKEIILRTRRFLNETLVDQIPALESVQRALEELSFMEPPSGTEEKFRSALIVEQVPRFMSSIDNPSKDWKAQVTRMERLLRDRAEGTKDAMRMARVFDLMLQGQ